MFSFSLFSEIKQAKKKNIESDSEPRSRLQVQEEIGDTPVDDNGGLESLQGLGLQLKGQQNQSSLLLPSFVVCLFLGFSSD